MGASGKGNTESITFHLSDVPLCFCGWIAGDSVWNMAQDRKGSGAVPRATGWAVFRARVARYG
jgi:hypothetical protein